MNKNASKVTCRKCRKELTIIFEEGADVDTYKCPVCGHLNPLDIEELQHKLGSSFEKMFGKKPDKPENN